MRRILLGLGSALLGFAFLSSGWLLWPLPHHKVSLPFSLASDQKVVGRLQASLPTALRLGQKTRLTLGITLAQPSSEPSRWRFQARLDLSGLTASPTGTQTVTLDTTRSAVTFVWLLKATTAGPYRGRLWVFLTTRMPHAPAPTETPVAVIPIQGSIHAFLGLSAPQAQGLASGLAALSILCGIGGMFLFRTPRSGKGKEATSGEDRPQ